MPTKDIQSRPLTRVDVVLFTVRDFWNSERSESLRLEVALTERDEPPFAGWFNLPGSAVRVDRDESGRMDHSDQDTAERVVMEKLRVRPAHLQQICAAYSRTLDPRGPVTAITYMALAPFDKIDYFEAQDITFYPVDELPKLAFDQAAVIAKAVECVRENARHSTLPAFMLPRLFTLKELKSLYASVLGRELDQSNFGRKFEEWGVLSMADDDTREAAAVRARARNTTGRPPQIFRLKGGAPVVFEKTAF